MVNNHERRMDKSQKMNVGILSSSFFEQAVMAWHNPLLSVALSLIWDPLAASDPKWDIQIAPVETKSVLNAPFQNNIMCLLSHKGSLQSFQMPMQR